jgi:hypothetical protein
MRAWVIARTREQITLLQLLLGPTVGAAYVPSWVMMHCLTVLLAPWGPEGHRNNMMG